MGEEEFNVRLTLNMRENERERSIEEKGGAWKRIE